MAHPFWFDVKTDRARREGGPEDRCYAAMADTQEEGLALIQVQPPETSTIRATGREFRISTVRIYDLEAGDVRWIR